MSWWPKEGMDLEGYLEGCNLTVFSKGEGKGGKGKT